MIQEKIAPFAGHLEELRKRLIIIVVAVVMGTGIAWNFSDDILTFIERPLTGHTYLSAVKKRVTALVGKYYPDFSPQYDPERASTGEPVDRKLNYGAPLEPFFIQCKVSLVGGLVPALPIIFHQLWLFAAPGLTVRERRLLVPFVVSATLAFCVGAVFFLTLIWPLIIDFSLSYESEGLRSWFSLSAYVNFCLRLILVFGLIFELPILAFLLSRFGLVSGTFLTRNRKYAVLASALIAAFHADLITMLVVMIPLYGMYEVSIQVARIFGRKRTAQGAART